MFLNVCKNTFHISHVRISQKVKGVLMWNFRHLVFIWRRRCQCTFKIKLTIGEYQRDRNISIYIWPNLSTRRRDIASCPWTKPSHLGKCSNGKLRTWTLANDETLRSTANFASTLSNVNNVKISDLLEFLVILLIFPLCSYLKIICRKLQDYEGIHEGDSFLIT